MSYNRRGFIKQASSILAASAGFRHAKRSWKTDGEKSTLETLRIGVVGFRGRGKSLINAIRGCKVAKLVALSDVDTGVLESFAQNRTELYRSDDFRRLLDRKDIDAIVSATPNHWHTLVSVLSVQAGKHVYIEKPISHNMFESRAVVQASKRYGKFIQCGFQNRSETGLIEFFERLHAGDFGKVTFVHGTCHRPRKSIGKLDKPLRIPKNVNYDLWLGPAADQDIMRPNLHYDWHWDFNTGNGDVGNQGPHEWDMMNWALGDSENLPEVMQAAGNRFGWNDAGNTPNVMACQGVLDETPFCFEVMDLKPGAQPPHGNGVGVIVETTQGRFVGSRGGGKFTFHDGKEERFTRDASQQKQDGTRAHMANFFDAVMTNDRSILRSDCKVAAKSASMAHIANISYQLARPVEKDELENAFRDSEQHRDMLSRLVESTRIYASKTGATSIETWNLGPGLAYDNAQQRFKNEFARDANGKMSRVYRTGFELPSIDEKKQAG